MKNIRGKGRPPPKYGSYSEDYLRNRDAQVPQVSALAMNGQISQYRKGTLEAEVNQGLYRDGSAAISSNADDTTGNSNVVSLVSLSRMGQESLSKTAQVIQDGHAGGWGNGGIGNTAMQMPEIYSPLWLTSNLNLPRDRATINAWARSYYALNPIVHNAIQLHSTYPISKMNIKCNDPKVQQFFEEQTEELDLINICSQIAQEYFNIGEAYPYAVLDQKRGKWSHIVLHNPDFIVVKRVAVAQEPIIMLRPDENLKNIVKSNRPSDIEQRRMLDPNIIDAVKRGQNIQLPGFNISQIARKISPYEIRGTGLTVCCFRWLMLADKIVENKFVQADNMTNPLTLVKIGTDGPEGLHPTHADLEAWRAIFECHDEETEVMTSEGFKRYDEVMEYTEVMDGTYGISRVSSARPKAGVKIACFNPDNEQIEYHEPTNASLYDYSGDMYHFNNRVMDIKITPNHKMWISQKESDIDGNRIWGSWKKMEAKDIDFSRDYARFRSQANWVGNDDIKSVKVNGKDIPIDLYLEFLGYVLSEGCLYSRKSIHRVILTQSVPKHYEKMKSCINKVAECLKKTPVHNIEYRKKTRGENYADVWHGYIHGREIYEHFRNEVGDDEGRTKSAFKRIPRWILDLSPRLLNILMNALLDGDGTRDFREKSNITLCSYSTISKQLSDDIFEMVYKCGMVPTQAKHPCQNNNVSKYPIYEVSWSNAPYGKGQGDFPLVYKYKSITKQSKNARNNTIQIEQYTGKVWCFEVPTGLFITRRNGKITIQGNSATANKDFKIFTHPGVSVERVGYNQGILDVKNDIDLCVKLIYTGLQVPSVLMDGGQDTSYANGGVALDVLRQRYLQFRNMLAAWLRRKIFAPIAEIQGFYEYEEGRKKLIVPDIEWNHMSLFDVDSYITNLVQLTVPGGEGAPPQRVSNHTLYRSLGLDFDDEQRKLRKEAIAAQILAKEQQALTAMSLTDIRSLDEDEDIPDPSATGQPLVPGPEAPVPGETPGLGAPPPMPGEFSPAPAGPPGGETPPPLPAGPGTPPPGPAAPPPPPAAP